MKPIWIPIVAALWICACRSSATRAESAGAPPNTTPSDPEIEAQLEMIDPKIVAQGNDRALELGLRNGNGRAQEFFFTVDWFDATGKPVLMSAHAWTRLAIERNATVPVRVEGVPVEARSWRLRFTSGR